MPPFKKKITVTLKFYLYSILSRILPNLSILRFAHCPELHFLCLRLLRFCITTLYPKYCFQTDHGHRAGESRCWMPCPYRYVPQGLQSDRGHRADKSGCWMPAYRDHKMNGACKHVKISAHHWFGTVVQLECVACAKWSYECLEKANINGRSEHLPMFAFQVDPNLSKQIGLREKGLQYQNAQQDVITCTNAY